MKDHLRTYAQRLLHAFAEAGSLPSAQELQPLIGPNGAVMWTKVAPASRPQLHSEDRLPTADSLAVPTMDHSRMDIRRPEPVDYSLEAPAV
jgi:hypothetical protein